jgi:tetratricopeptide (TPR) repeat protein
VDLANNQRDDFMKSEALLNLARANERLAEFEKAIGYAENSLALPGIDNRSPGYAHLGWLAAIPTFCLYFVPPFSLVIALSQMGLSNFQQSLQQFEMAMKIAIETADKLLELQISLGLGHLFTLMRLSLMKSNN